MIRTAACSYYSVVIQFLAEAKTRVLLLVSVGLLGPEVEGKS
jgi:hypothetical protein